MFPLVLALDQTGHPHSWMSWEDAVVQVVKDNVAWQVGSEDFIVHGGTSRLTGTQSSVDVNTIIALKGQFKRRDKVVLTNENLFKRDLGICGYCGRHFTSAKLTRDHIIPTSKGGKNIWTNVITACKGCNNYKGDKLLGDLDMELLYVPYEPSPIEALIMRNRNILACQMEFLKQHLPKHSRLHKLC